MKIMVVGAAGALGVPLVEELQARKHHVIALTRTHHRKHLIQDYVAETVVADALDAKALEAALKEQRPTHVVNLLTALPKAGPTRFRHLKATDTLRTRGTENLIRACREAGVRRLVAQSFAFIHGFGDLGARPREEGEGGQEREAHPALQEAVDALRSLEGQMTAAHQSGWMETVCLRLGVLYGPQNPGTLALLRMLRWRVLPVPARGNGFCPFTHQADAVEALIAALEAGRSGEAYHVCHDQSAGMDEFVRALAASAGAPRPVTVSPWLIKVMAPMAAVLFSSRLAVSNAKARRDLGWQPAHADIHQGLSAAFSNYAA